MRSPGIKQIDPVIAHKALLIVSDVICIIGVFYASYNLRNFFFEGRGGVYNAGPQHLLFLGLYIFVTLLYFRNGALYKRRGFGYSHHHFATLTKSWAVSGLLFIVMAFFFDIRLFIDHRITTAIYLGMGYSALIITRFAIVPWLAGMISRHRVVAQNVLIVGAGEGGRSLADYLYEFDRVSTRLVGFVDDSAEMQGQSFHGTPVLGTTEALSGLIRQERVHEVFVAIPSLAPVDLTRILDILHVQPVRIRVATEPFRTVYEKAAHMLDVERGMLVMNDTKILWVDRFLKRTIDLIGSAVGLVILSPVFAIIAILIKRDSEGPVFFRQDRTGWNGKTFSVYKFRTMRKNTEAHHKEAIAALMHEDVDAFKDGDEGPFFKKTDEMQVTAVGNFLRKSSLDELPQLINVLKGEMSLVGPRPEPTYQVDMYQPWHHARHKIKPGMTGFWQVFGRSTVTHNDMVLMDVFYIENWSLALDLRILFNTPYVMVTGKGAK